MEHWADPYPLNLNLFGDQERVRVTGKDSPAAGHYDALNTSGDRLPSTGPLAPRRPPVWEGGEPRVQDCAPGSSMAPRRVITPSSNRTVAPLSVGDRADRPHLGSVSVKFSDGYLPDLGSSCVNFGRSLDLRKSILVQPSACTI